MFKVIVLAGIVTLSCTLLSHAEIKEHPGVVCVRVDFDSKGICGPGSGGGGGGGGSRGPALRPVPLVSVPTSDPSSLLRKISQLLPSSDFSVRPNYLAGTLEAVTDSGATQGEDYYIVVIWLERNFARPQEVLDVHFSYARYGRVIGGPAEPVRIFTPDPTRENKVIKVRDRLFKLAEAYTQGGSR